MASQKHYESDMTATVAGALGLGDGLEPVGLVGVGCAVSHEGQKGAAAFHDDRTEDGHGFIDSDGWSAAPAHSWRTVGGGKRELGMDDAEGGGRREEEQKGTPNSIGHRNEKRSRRVPKECRDLVNDMMEDSDSDVTLAKEPISVSTTATHHPIPYDVTMNNLELRVRQLEQKVENLIRASSRTTNPKEAEDVESSNTEDVVTKRIKFCGTHTSKRRKEEKRSVGCT